MRYIFTALRAEASALIRELNLKPAEHLSACYKNENTVLAVTGTGPLSASAVCGAVLSSSGVSDRDILINAGIAASVTGGNAGMLYAVHRIHDLSSGRDYYPDLIPLSACPEAMLYTGAKPYHGDSWQMEDAQEPVVLYDMEAAGIVHAASMFLSPHRIRVLKLVSDFGEREKLKFETSWAETIAEAVQREAAAMETIPARAEKIIPDCEQLSVQLNATVAMKRRLQQALRYAELAGIDWQKIIHDYQTDGLLPALNKEAGKQIMEKLIYELQD